MGKSPGKWIKNVFLGKKSSKSSLSKDAISEIKVSATGNTQSKDLGPDSMVISSPVRPIIDSNEEHTELENNPVSNNLITETREEIRAPMDLNSMNSEELIKLEQAATKAQAAFRGYLARRAFWALKGIIRLQALVRGHLVRRQAVATLKCMRAIVEFQALVRGRTVRISGNGQLLQKHSSREFVDKKSSELLLTSLREEKLSKNVFATKLVASSHTTVPLSFQYEPTEPNSVRNWLDRWSTSHFWDPLPQPKKIPDSKPKRKQTKIQSEETETTKPKRIIRNNNNLSNSSENEKSRRTVRKPTHHQIEPVQDQSLNELEKVKRNLRKISLSSTSEIEKTEKTEKIEKTEKSENTEMPLVLDEGIKINGSHVESVKEAEVEVEAEVEAVPPVVIEEKPVEVTEDENLPINEKVPLNGKEEHGSSKENNQKTRRRKSLPPKQEYNESVSPNTPTLPSYMAATESAKAKLRAQKAAEEAAAAAVENGGSRRQSLPAAGGKLSLNSTSPSPRVHKPVHVNGKGGSKPNKSQISPRDEKVLQAGWRR